jgi:DNA repair protein RadC
VNEHSKAIADLVHIAARTPPDAPRRNPEEDILTPLAVLIGQTEAEKIEHLNIGAVAMMTTAELRVHGLSARAAGQLRAAFKLAIKAANEAPLPAAKISAPGAVADLMRDRVALLSHEEVWALFLNKANQVKADLLVSRMGFDYAHVDGRVVFHGALEVRALAFILVHNHPSGDPTPSQADRGLSKQLSDQGKVMAIPLLDHVIIARGGYTSLQSMGVL